ncbi:MAG TPA: hypothetical protein VKT31_13165 [Solirubrobacteraceae bacterium]|nr:hypothetical protein [Solirubrobacteraceae bacterium]
MDPEPTVTVLDRGGPALAGSARTFAVGLAIAATAVVLALTGLGSGAHRHTPTAQRVAPIPPLIGVRFDTRLDGDEGQPGGRRPDADDR